MATLPGPFSRTTATSGKAAIESFYPDSFAAFSPLSQRQTPLFHDTRRRRAAPLFLPESENPPVPSIPPHDMARVP